MVLDHVIYATGDLDAAAGRVREELGLTVVPGGRHEGLGTHNRIVPLGGGYLELMAIADPAEAAGSELGRVLADRVERDGDGLFAWCVAVDEVAAVAKRLGASVITIRREGLSARLTGLPEAIAEPHLPFFIERDAGIPDPGANGDAGGITWVEVAGDRARLERWLDGVPLPVRVADGPPRVLAMGIGDRELRTG